MVAYPILGEPLAIEFVNTRYQDPMGHFDFLASAELATGWFAALASDEFESVVIVSTETMALVELRDAARALFSALTEGAGEPPQDAIDQVNAAIEGNRHARELRWSKGKEPEVVTHTTTQRDGIDNVLAVLAAHIVDVVAGQASGPARICERPDCSMYYLQQHHRRRYCNPACASADRQARYYRRRVG